jgi:hypothetical protein
MYIADYTTVICEGETGDVVCPPNTVIHVVTANYGRTESVVCWKINESWNLNCHSGPAAQDAAISACEGKGTCILHPTDDSMGGDPCRNMYKYLEILYRCY